MSDQDRPGAEPRLDRRAALARIGIAATSAYVAPLLMTLSSARASSRGSASGNRGHGSGCSGSGHCGSGHRSPYRHDHDHGGYYYRPYPPVPHERPRAGVYLVLPPVEITIRP